MGNVRDTWTPEGRRFMQQLQELSKLEVKVGFQGGKEYYEEDGKQVDVLDVAMWNELGNAHTPSRPFMRDAVDTNESLINNFLKEQKQELINGKTAERVYQDIGVFMKALIQDQIVTGSFTPNSPSTIRKKGSSQPLIDTGHMRQAVNFEVKRKGANG